MPSYPEAPRAMQLRYAQLEELVGGLLEVHADRRKTLGARLRLFRLRGFPPDVATTAKTRFAYDLEAVLRVSLAMLMLDAFVPQELAPVVIERDWTKLKSAFRSAYTLIRDKGDAAAAVDGDRPVLLLSPRNLHAFTLDKYGKADPEKTVMLQLSTARAASDRLLDQGGGETFETMTVIDLHRVAAWVRNAILRLRWAGPELFDDFAAE